MKTNVSIKFNSVEEYREIEKKLIELGYQNDVNWNKEMLRVFQSNTVNLDHYVLVYKNVRFEIHNHNDDIKYQYNSLEEFLKD